jgi:hypothetical protein
MWFCNGEGNIFHLPLTGYFKLSSIPNLASSIHTDPSFRTTVDEMIALSTINKLKGYADWHPAFASFLTTSAFLLNVRISIHFEFPIWLFEAVNFFRISINELFTNLVSNFVGRTTIGIKTRLNK